MNNILIVCMLAAACSVSYDASFEDCTIQCTADTRCPDGLACGAEGLCRLPDASETCATVTGAFPSCDGLPATCGPTANGNCCESPRVPGGTFLRSYDEAPDGMFADASFPATVSPFALDKYEVTVGRFRRFVESGTSTAQEPPASGSGAHARVPGSSWDANWNAELATDGAALEAALQCDASYQTWTAAPGSNEALPINCVTWYEAMAFCIWDGGYLPTEAEWNFAAAGGNEQRAYPWSSPADSLAVDCSHANYMSGSLFCATGNAMATMNRVGSEPSGNGTWGHSGLAGNAWEWALDWFAQYDASCTDCANLTPSGNRVIRGGNFSHTEQYMRSADRGLPTLENSVPTNRTRDVGFRCARP